MSDDEKFNKVETIICLNPYYTGSTLWGEPMLANAVMTAPCLNPYYTGSTLWEFKPFKFKRYAVVLILIILEVLYESRGNGVK